MAGAADGGDFARFCSLELGSSCTEEEKEDWDGTRSFEVVREVKSGAQRDGRRVEARRRPQSPVWRRASQ